MVTQEMLIRGRARTVLIVCPTRLQLHWQEQMRDKFGLNFRMVDSSTKKQLRLPRDLSGGGFGQNGRTRRRAAQAVLCRLHTGNALFVCNTRQGNAVAVSRRFD
jgi:hypothetical protein